LIFGIRAFSFVVGALSFAALADGKPARVPAGTWGGQGIALEVTDKGATLDYDCAHGTVDEAMKLDSSGRFEVKGVHFREHGGPVREGEEAKGQPVRYTGKVEGETMTLTIKGLDKDEPIGAYTLGLGKLARIRRCM
jgi:hypothetical protein